MKNTHSIKNWVEEDRPREKMMLSGSASLTSTELLAILIQSGTRNKSALDLARELLSESGGRLDRLSGKSVKQLKAVPGIGDAKAITLLAAFELGRRLSAEMPEESTQIRESLDIARMMSPALKQMQHEECWIIYLNRDNRYLGKERISSGGQSATVIDVKIIVRNAVERLASGLVLVHNHPSGNPHPGQQDRKQTELLRKAAAMFDIQLLDHIIIAGNKYFSFSDEMVNLVKK